MTPGLLQSVLENLPDAAYLIDPATSNILYSNRRGLEDVQLHPEELLHHSVITLQKDVAGLPAWEDIAKAITQTDVFTFVGRHCRKDGSEFPVEVNTSSFVHDGRQYFLSIARDLTRQRQHEQDLRIREPQLWFALNEGSDGLWDWNVETGEVFFSPQLKQMLGYGPNEMKPELSTWEENIHPEDRKRVLRNINDHLRGLRESYLAQYRLKNRNGHYLWVRDQGKLVEESESGEPLRMVGMVQNITDEKIMEEKLQRFASHDSLTGLLNRRQGELLFEQQLEIASRLKMELGVCLFDLDRFKQVNDRFGHLAGDEVLKQVVNIAQGLIRKSDIMYRWGGEEFVVILPDSDIDKLKFLADKLRTGIALHDWGGELGVPGVTASFGLALFPVHGDSPQALVLNADAAMYQSKSRGRDCVTVAEVD